MEKVIGICIIIFIALILFGLSIFRIYNEYKNDADKYDDRKSDNGYDEFTDNFII